MNQVTPILSICIPTYNRAEYLQKTLDRIVNYDEFLLGEIEVVISDNASTDSTEEIVRVFLEKYDNILYSRNNENVIDKNIPIVLSKANGIYKKLWNDTMIPNDDAFKMMLQIIKRNLDDKPVIFWNQPMDGCGNVIVQGLDESLKYISYWATSISCFGVWSEDFEYNEKGCDKCLWQVPNLFDAINKKEKVVICTNAFYTVQYVKNKDVSYGLFNVFYTNFLGIIREYNVSEKIYDIVEKELLLKFFRGFVLAQKLKIDSYKYSETEEFEKLLRDVYKKKYYYIGYRIILFFQYKKNILKCKIKLLLKKIKKVA